MGVDRMPRLLLRLEGVVLAAATLAVYLHLDYSVLALVAILVAVDLSLVGFLFGPKAGSLTYNLAHTTAVPLVLGAAGVLGDEGTLVQVALAWLAHLGIDRALGLGLKYSTAFTDTHLQRV
jgi:uncharacterized protein DUF4260